MCQTENISARRNKRQNLCRRTIRKYLMTNIGIICLFSSVRIKDRALNRFMRENPERTSLHFQPAKVFLLVLLLFAGAGNKISYTYSKLYQNTLEFSFLMETPFTKAWKDFLILIYCI